MSEPRTSDPATEPPPVSSADEPLGRLREVAAWGEWRALGLGDVDATEDEEVDLARSVIDPPAGEGNAA